MNHDDHPPTPDDAGDGGSNREEKALFAAQLESMANTVGALALEVQAMKAQPAGSEPALGPRLFADSTGLGGSVDAEEALRSAEGKLQTAQERLDGLRRDGQRGGGGVARGGAGHAPMRLACAGTRRTLLRFNLPRLTRSERQSGTISRRQHLST